MNISYQTLLNYLDLYTDKISELEHFINEYNSIIKLDKEKPRFSLTKRYSKFPAYQKFQRSSKYVDFKRSENVWNPKIELKISNKIKMILNKLTEHNYKKLCSYLLDEIKELNHISVFDILNQEILEKCIFDKEFHYIYIHLCELLWNCNDLYNNYISIKNKNNKYYWCIKNDKNEYGPFTNIKYLYKDVKGILSYKNKFLTYFIEQFKTKNQIYKDIKDEKITGDNIYKQKTKIQSFLQFVIKLYNSKLIDFSYINNMFEFIFTEEINKNDVEYLYHSMSLFTDYEKVNPLIFKFKNHINYDSFERRIQFFSDQIINMATIKEEVIELDYDDYINIYIKNKITLEDLLNKINNSYEVILSEMFYNIQKYDIYIKIIEDSYNKNLLSVDLLKESITKIIEDYDDLKIDVPKMNVYFVKLLNDIYNLFEVELCNNELIEVINNNLESSSKNELYNHIISDCSNVSATVYDLISK